MVPEMLEFMLELKQHVTVRRTSFPPKLLLLSLLSLRHREQAGERLTESQKGEEIIPSKLLLLLLQRETDGKPKGEELIPSKLLLLLLSLLLQREADGKH